MFRGIGPHYLIGMHVDDYVGPRKGNSTCFKFIRPSVYSGVDDKIKYTICPGSNLMIHPQDDTRKAVLAER